MEREKQPASEPLKKGAQAVNAVRGAVKTGKAIAGAAKGAAVGGPYGAAAGFVLGNRKLIGGIVIAVIAVMLIPVVLICMLPPLIFGGFTSAFSPDDPAVPILNSSTAVNANITDISVLVSTVLSESLTDLLAQIDTDFASSGADQKEIINPYENAPTFNANRFVGQYCASKSEDFQAISIQDMESTLRQNKDKLYSYSKTIEERTNLTTTVTADPVTGQEIETTTSATETWATYTISYNGESYFADAVFRLTDKQKALAEDYAQNLTLFLNSSP